MRHTLPTSADEVNEDEARPQRAPDVGWRPLEACRSGEAALWAFLRSVACEGGGVALGVATAQAVEAIAALIEGRSPNLIVPLPKP